jgi:hypothetical protein
MPRELELFGFYFPTLLPMFPLAFGLQWLIDSALGRLDFYRHVWYPSLFRFGLFVCLIGAFGLPLYR